MKRPTQTEKSVNRAKPRLKWTGVLFAFAMNMLLTTGGDLLAATLPFGFNGEILATMVAPLVAGLLTAVYTRERGGMHAFLGAMLSVPVLTLYVFAQNWQLAVLSGAFCTMGGALTEIALRRRTD